MAALDTSSVSSNSRRKSGLAPPSQRMGGRGHSLESFGGLSRRSLGDSSRHSLGRRQSIGASSVQSVLSSSSTHTSSGNASKNPITNDVRLNILVHDKLEGITKYKQFKRWKIKFMERFDTYLTQSGMDPADAASRQLRVHLDQCIMRADNVLERIDAGDLDPVAQKRTAKASLALRELCVSIEECRMELEDLVPAKQIDERRKRYTKFHVGASLIRAGFPQFVAMKMLEEAVYAIYSETYDPETDYDSLEETTRKLLTDYTTQVQRFCEIMADLDLYDIMLKCVEFLNPPENEDDDDVEELTIFVKRYDPYGILHQQQQQQQPTNLSTIKSGSFDGTDPTDSGSEASFKEDSGRGFGNLSLPSRTAPITVKVHVEDSETIASVAAMVAEDLGFRLKPLDTVDITHQLTVRYADNTMVENPKTMTLKQLGIEQGDVLTLELALVPVKVRRLLQNGEKVELDVLIDPLARVRDLKLAVEHLQHQRGDGIMTVPFEDQRLFLGGVELDDDDRTCSGYGVVSGSVLDLEAREIPTVDVIEGEEEKIVIVDTKYGTMFSVDRAYAIEEGVLTPKIMNTDDDFLEMTKKDIDKDRMLKSMMSSPNLQVKPQIVVKQLTIEGYELPDETAGDVKNMWGIELKKSTFSQRGTEIFFVDLLTKAVGFLDRKKLMDKGIITVINATLVSGDNTRNSVEKKTLKQGEKDVQKYDFFVVEIRKIFGIEYEESLKKAIGLQAEEAQKK